MGRHVPVIVRAIHSGSADVKVCVGVHHQGTSDVISAMRNVKCKV
jgi:hypothetical protein